MVADPAGSASRGERAHPLNGATGESALSPPSCGRRAAVRPTGVAHPLNLPASRTSASTRPAGIAHLDLQASRNQGAWLLWILECLSRVQPTSLTIRRERRGRMRELPWLLPNLGCSAASVASTRRSSLASSCWLASHGRRSGRQRKSWITGSSAERGHWRVRPLAALVRASRSSQSDRRRSSAQLAGIAHLRINETCWHRASLRAAGVAQPRRSVALDPRVPQPSPANVFAHQARAARSSA